MSSLLCITFLQFKYYLNKKTKKTLDSFWLSLTSEYTTNSQKMILLLLLFTTLYLCELTFYAMNNIKTSSRNL